MANKEHLAILEIGVDVWNQWREENPKITPILKEVELQKNDLQNANFSNAILQTCNFDGTNLSYSDFRDSIMDRSTFIKTSFKNTNLSEANFERALMSEISLHSANLSGANLKEADLENANLERANLQNACIERAYFHNTNLKFITINQSSIKHIPESIRQQYSNTWLIIDKVEETITDNLIIRSITFPPEYHQAGISILNYFGEVLRKKFPDTKAKIQIKQEGLRVTMIIEPSDGSDKQIIEKALDDYGLVVTGKMEPEKFTEDRIMLIELRSELRTAFNKIELQKELIQDKNIQIDKLLSIVGTAVQSHPQVSVFQDQNNCPSLNHTNAQTIESLVQSEIIENLNHNREENMGDSITINAKGDVAFGKDQAIVTINKTISNADIPETLENKLKQLTQIVEQLSAEKTVPEDQSKNVTSNLERFVTEAAKPEPEKQWCQITGKGLIEAAQTVGSIAKPVIDTTQVILKMLGF